jgi:RNA polymerase sigma-70 factor (ECF subfamily)
MPLRDFAGIYDEHVWRVYGFFAYWVRSRPDAEDLTQQTFERAFRAWNRYDEARASVSTWLLAIARNLMVDHMRAGAGTRQRPMEDSDLNELPAAPDRRRLGIDPDLERALAELGARERELIALRFGGDLSCPEIAELTGLTLANVQQILSRSLRRMRTNLDGTGLHEAHAPVAAPQVSAG